MSNIFRKSYTLPIPTGAELTTIKGVPSARFKRRGKTITAPLTVAGDRVRVQSPFYYGTVDGKPVRLFKDAVASQQRLAELVRKSERKESGLADPFEEHRLRPLAEHLADWRKSLSRGAGESHVSHCISSVRRILETCEFRTMQDLSASRVEEFLSELQKDRSIALDPTKEAYTKAELAAVLGIKPGALTPLIRRHRLEAEGNGKARRYPKVTAERLSELRRRGHSTKTTNLYLAAMKTFCRWLVKNRRMAESPLEHLSGGNVELDRRHDRRMLDEGELRRVMEAARKSDVVFRGLTGRDREMLYLTACVTGYRAGELAVLCPKDFKLDEDSPQVTLSAVYTKNNKTAIQPIPAEAVPSLRSYLAGRPLDAPVWPGTWHERASDMVRIELDACGIPYVVQGPDGPLFADFHAAGRHSYVGLLDKAGATLKEAMQLARHSDPKLTLRVYGKARLGDLASAVDRLPSLLSPEPVQAESEALAATGTDGRPVMRLPFTCRDGDESRGEVKKHDEEAPATMARADAAELIAVTKDADACGKMRKTEESSPTRTRT